MDFFFLNHWMGFPGGSMIKNDLAMQETWVWSLSQEDALEKEMAAHSSILTWEIPWIEMLSGLQSIGSQESDTTEWLNHHHNQSFNNIDWIPNKWLVKIHYVKIYPHKMNIQNSDSLLCKEFSLSIFRSSPLEKFQNPLSEFCPHFCIKMLCNCHHWPLSTLGSPGS